MKQNFLPELLSVIPLSYAFVILWRQRKHFNSLRMIIVGVALLLAANLAAVFLQHPTIRFSGLFGLSPALFETILNAVEDFTSALGVLSLVMGFVETIEFEQAEEIRIDELEGLLPVCANCKKYRTPENIWMPIEHYLTKDGAARLTHGICPDCMTKLYGDNELLKRSMKVKNQ